MKIHLMDGTLNIVDAIYLGLNEELGGQRVFTTSELKRYTNLENGLYLSILGQVFDVTKGEKHYGPGKQYHAFIGRDASLAFITGEFEEELTDDISSLSARQVKTLDDWLQFYNTNYIYKGKLYGRYYNRDGSPTAESDKVQEKLLVAKQEKSLEEKQKRMFPPCNIEWNPEIGTLFWCTNRSGGIERDWVGVPRMLFETASTQSTSRCACVKLDSMEYEENKAMLREYNGCAKYETKCVLETTKS
ncbi:cytochrome b5 domain-containing protein 2 [Lasius niger]|uniref:Cytochrome b5 domain-containing protein 2 n=2 Tax=Lasius TaxID=488720 RepID=A0A0J7L2A5_LASNI|nr:cytochrome b5 domain-containing protein 2 [Lasius niger]